MHLQRGRLMNVKWRFQSVQVIRKVRLKLSLRGLRAFNKVRLTLHNTRWDLLKLRLGGLRTLSRVRLKWNFSVIFNRLYLSNVSSR